VFKQRLEKPKLLQKWRLTTYRSINIRITPCDWGNQIFCVIYTAHSYLHHFFYIAFLNKIFVCGGMIGAASMRNRSTNDCDHVLCVRDENFDLVISRTSESTKNRISCLTFRLAWSWWDCGTSHCRRRRGGYRWRWGVFLRCACGKRAWCDV